MDSVQDPRDEREVGPEVVSKAAPVFQQRSSHARKISTLVESFTTGFHFLEIKIQLIILTCVLTLL